MAHVDYKKKIVNELMQDDDIISIRGKLKSIDILCLIYFLSGTYPICAKEYLQLSDDEVQKLRKLLGKLGSAFSEIMAIVFILLNKQRSTRNIMYGGRRRGIMDINYNYFDNKPSKYDIKYVDKYLSTSSKYSGGTSDDYNDYNDYDDHDNYNNSSDSSGGRIGDNDENDNESNKFVSMQPIQPIQPMQPIQSTQPMQPMQPMQPTQSIQSMQSIQPTQSMQPIQSTQLLQPSQLSIGQTIPIVSEHKYKPIQKTEIQQEPWMLLPPFV
jgi:hypothetical protein